MGAAYVVSFIETPEEVLLRRVARLERRVASLHSRLSWMRQSRNRWRARAKIQSRGAAGHRVAGGASDRGRTSESAAPR